MNRTRTPRRPRRVRTFSGRDLEALESRRLMAVFTVNSYNDVLNPPAGTVTLRSAIQAANNSPGADTIDIAVAGTYSISTIGSATDNSAGEFAIADAGDLTIQNTSGGTVTIDGGGLNRVLDVDPAGLAMPFTVTLSGLVITGGALSLNGDDGAGVDVHGAANLVLASCQVVGNSDYGSSGGGGVAMEAGGTGNLTVSGTRIAGNTVNGSGGGIAALGSGTVAIVGGSVVEGNTALGSGGGIYLDGSPLNVVGSIIRDNRALVFLTTNGSGGGIDNAGGGAVAISGSILEGNSAADNGGGYADAGLATLAVANSFVLDNSAPNNGGGIAASGAAVNLTNTAVVGDVASAGAGLYTSGTGTVRLADDLFSGDVAFQSGGGVFNTASKLVVTGSTFEADRTALNNGAGLYSDITSGDVSISDSLFDGDAAGFIGGGVVVTGGTFELAASRFAGDSAGSASALDVASSFTISGSTFDSGRASDASALTLLVAGSLTNCTVAFNTSSDAAVLISGTVAMVDDTIDGNVATSGSAGGVGQQGGTVNVQGTIIAHNTASGASADYDLVDGTLNDNGGNLLTTLAGAGGKFGASTIVADPKLGPLIDNGGQAAGAPSSSQIVPTQALLPGSPAFNRGVSTGAPTTDERGFPRPGHPSIGAYEPQYASNASANQVFVENLFEVLLNRVADPGSLANAVNYLNGGGAGVTLVQILQGSAEFRGIEATQVFRRYLDRAPSPAEQGNAANYLATATPEQLAALLVEQPEFFNDYGQSTDVFVEALYGDILDSTASSIERAGWVQLITNNGTRAGVAGIFLGLPTYLDLLLDADYPAYVGRMASPAEQANLAKMWPGFNSLDIQALLLGYGEAFARRT